MSEEKQEIELNGNSFSVFLSKVKAYKGRSASLIFKNNNKNEFEIFTQEGFEIKKNSLSEINLPSSFYREKSGGVKSVFLIKNNYFALISSKNFSCLYASLVNLKNKKELIKSECLPDNELVDFNGLGGAYVQMEDSIILTVGAPEHKSEEIAKLAQEKNSIFGKILQINNESLLNNNKDIEYSIFSMGHKNPQGLVLYKDYFFSLEHGPQGGDELNIIIEGKNYGWPIVSLGTKYFDGKSYPRSHTKYKFQEPLLVFSPAVAPSALNICPINLSNYYKNYNCLMGLSLRDMSILIFLLDKKNIRVVNVEKILLDKRLRHFGLDVQGNLFVDSDNYFYITADEEGMFKVKFDKFR